MDWVVMAVMESSRTTSTKLCSLGFRLDYHYSILGSLGGTAGEFLHIALCYD